MPDIDVAAVELASPPAAAPVTQYRPAVDVANNGVAPAAVTGWLRVYRREPPGDLLQTWTLSHAGIAPGATGTAQANGYWIPTDDDVGKEFVFIGFVTTPGDMVYANNPVNPVTVLVTAAAPPPPPPVLAHATQHEYGGSDMVDVTNLAGQLLEPQKIAAHKTTHQLHGQDQLSVSGLPGLLEDPQTPTTHGNERHAISYASEPYVIGQVTAHDTDPDAHNASKGPPVQSKGGLHPTTGPVTAFAPYEHQHGGEGAIDAAAVTNVSGVGDTVIATWTIENGCLVTGVQGWLRYAVSVDGYFDITEAPGAGCCIIFDLLAGPDPGSLVVRQSLSVPVASATTNGQIQIHFMAFCWETITWSEARAHLNTDPAETLVLSPISETPVLSREAEQLWQLRVTLAPTTTINYGQAISHLHCCSIDKP